MTNTTYKNFVSRWERVMELEPQKFGPLTPHYKFLAQKLKTMPIRSFVLLATIVVVGVYFFVGSFIPALVTLLQRGF